MTFSMPTFLIIWFSLVLNSPVGLEFNTSEFMLKGPVKRLYFDPANPLNEKSSKINGADLILFTFDKQGYLSSYTKGSSRYTIRNTYYPSGKIMQKLHFSQNGALLTQEFFYYDKLGRMSQNIKISSSGGATIFQYKYQNNFLHHVKVINQYSFKQEEITNISSLQSRWEDSPPRFIYHFDTERKLIRVETYTKEKLKSSDILSYDQQNRLLSIEGALNLKLQYNYDPYPIAMSMHGKERSIENTLDDQGNPIKISDTIVNGSTTERIDYVFKIDYWK